MTKTELERENNMEKACAEVRVVYKPWLLAKKLGKENGGVKDYLDSLPSTVVQAE